MKTELSIHALYFLKCKEKLKGASPINTGKETNDRKEEVEITKEKCVELSDDELEKVAGGVAMDVLPFTISVPTTDEPDVVELNIANVIIKGNVLVPAVIEIQEEDKALLP